MVSVLNSGSSFPGLSQWLGSLLCVLAQDTTLAVRLPTQAPVVQGPDNAIHQINRSGEVLTKQTALSTG